MSSLSQHLSGSRTSLATSTGSARSSGQSSRWHTNRLFYVDPADVYGVIPGKLAPQYRTGKSYEGNAPDSTRKDGAAHRGVNKSAYHASRKNSSITRDNKSHSRLKRRTSSVSLQHFHVSSSKLNRRRKSSEGSVPSRAIIGHGNKRINTNVTPKQDQAATRKPKLLKQKVKHDASRRHMYQAFRQSSLVASAIASVVVDYKHVARADASLTDIRTLRQLEDTLKETLQSFENLESRSTGRNQEERMLSYLQKSVSEFLIRPVAWRGLEKVKRTNMVKRYNTTIDKWFYGPMYEPKAEKAVCIDRRHDGRTRRTKASKCSSVPQIRISDTAGDPAASTTKYDGLSLSSLMASTVSDSTTFECSTPHNSADASTYRSFSSDEGTEEDSCEADSSEGDTSENDCETVSSDSSGRLVRELDAVRQESDGKHGRSGQEQIQHLVNQVTGIMRFYDLVQRRLYERELTSLQADRHATTSDYEDHAQNERHPSERREAPSSRHASESKQGRKNNGIGKLDVNSITSSDDNLQVAATSPKPGTGPGVNKSPAPKKAAITHGSLISATKRPHANVNEDSSVGSTAMNYGTQGSNSGGAQGAESATLRKDLPNRSKKTDNEKLIKNRQKLTKTEAPTANVTGNTEDSYPVSPAEKRLYQAVDKYFETETKSELGEVDGSRSPGARTVSSPTEATRMPPVNGVTAHGTLNKGLEIQPRQTRTLARLPSLEQYDMTRTRRQKFYVAQT